jgi:hypothetical protein
MAPAKANRPYRHAFEARRSSARVTHKINWIRKIQAEGREPAILILEELQPSTTREFVGFVEKCYIKSLREIGHRLTNSTDGGEGVLNPSVENRAAKSARSKGNKYALGYVQTEEQKKRRGRSIAKYWAEHPGECVVSKERREKIAKTLTGYKHTPEACANMGASRIGSKRSDEAKKHMSDAQKGHEVSQSARAKLAMANLGKVHSAETCRKRSISVMAAKGTIEARLSASIKQTEAWRQRRIKKEGALLISVA